MDVLDDTCHQSNGKKKNKKNSPAEYFDSHAVTLMLNTNTISFNAEDIFPPMFLKNTGIELLTFFSSGRI